MEHLQTAEAEEVLATGEHIESALLNVLVSTHPAHERGVPAPLRVRNEVLWTQRLTARNAMQRTSLAALNTWSRNHWSGTGRRCHSARFTMILVQFFLAKILG